MRETIRAVIIDNDRRTFLVQHKERNSADLGKWGNAGGGLDDSDKDHIQCLKRELQEEFGAGVLTQITIGKKLRVNHRPDRVDHFYAVKFIGTSLIPKVPDEIINFCWFSVEEASKLNLFFGFESRIAEEAIRSLGF